MGSKFESYNGKKCFVMSRPGSWTIMATLGRVGQRETPEDCLWVCKRNQRDVFVFRTREEATVFACKHEDLGPGLYRVAEGEFTRVPPLVEAV